MAARPLAALFLMAGLLGVAPTPAELALSDRAYAQLRARHELLDRAPEAALVAPVAARLNAVAGPQYGAPFTFFIDRSDVPNAFVLYGPRVYVDRGLVRFADSREALAGVLCHEMNHVLHRDAFKDDALADTYDARTKAVISRAETLTHGRGGRLIERTASLGESLGYMRHSRAEETAADLAGANLCASAGYNPWGLVWMFRKFERARIAGSRLAFLSDHPATQARIAHLRRYITAHPALFGRWHDDESGAVPLHPRMSRG